MRFVAVLSVTFACSGAFASELGSPLDCSDWVIHMPGVSCTTLAPYPCTADDPTLCYGFWGANIDNNGNGVYVRSIEIGMCSAIGRLYRKELILANQRGDGTVVASVSDRCVDGVGDYIASINVGFDAVQGRLLVPLANNSTSAYGYGYQRIAFTGLASLFDVLQTYTPQPASLGFRVPYMPEGMAGADHFDTYWGPLTRPIDFTQAHPLQCGYPVAPPHVGDYLAVADTVPTPAPGQGVYYITAATYQGATRYGRKTTAGYLSGRDPAALPVCRR
jgi:hypothetical protein